MCINICENKQACRLFYLQVQVNGSFIMVQASLSSGRGDVDEDLHTGEPAQPSAVRPLIQNLCLDQGTVGFLPPVTKPLNSENYGWLPNTYYLSTYVNFTPISYHLK